MDKSIIRSALLYAGLLGSIFLMDLVIERWFGGKTEFVLPHILFAVMIALISFVILRQAMEARLQAEAVLRQARDEMEMRVIERTAELEYTNEILRVENAERLQAEQLSIQSLAKAEEARRRAEDLAGELQVANNKIYALLETLPVGMIISDEEGGIMLANPLARSIMGSALTHATYDPKSFPRLYRIADGSLYLPEELPLYCALKYGDITTGLEIGLRHADDREVFVFMASSPVRDESGKIISGVKIVQDITERKRSEEALRRARAELELGLQERAAIAERQHLARELHDSISQVLYGISLGAHTALTLFDTDRAKVQDALNYVISLVQTGLVEMRAMIFELRPDSLEVEGLNSALTRHVMALRARNAMEIELDLCTEPEVSLSIKEALYRIVQEALQNAVKHAQASRLEVHLDCESDNLKLEICDNGVGFDSQSAFPGHLGLRSMHERAVNLGGSLDIESKPGIGTRIHVCVPISQVLSI